MGVVGFLHGDNENGTRKEHVMRRFLQLAMVLLVAVVAAGSPLATVNVLPAIPAAAAPQVAAVSSTVSTPSLICILPRCNGPYCRASNGCWVCCTN
jgi:hypothetical protein